MDELITWLRAEINLTERRITEAQHGDFHQAETIERSIAMTLQAVLDKALRMVASES